MRVMSALGIGSLPITQKQADSMAAQSSAPPKPWRIPSVEVYLYSGLTAWAIYLLYSRGVALSNEYAEHFAQQDLRPGWIFDWHMDLSDVQWREFRASLPLLTCAFAGFWLLSQLARRLGSQAQLIYYLVFSTVFMLLLHGAYAFYVAALLLLNFALASQLAGRRFAMACMWAFHIATFLAVRIFEGFPLDQLPAPLHLLELLLGSKGGMLRWHIHYNLLVLRMISFSTDLHWTVTKRPPRTRLPANTPPHPDLDLRAR